MVKVRNDLSGQKFGKLLVIKQSEIFINKLSIASCCKKSGTYKGLKIERIST